MHNTNECKCHKVATERHFKKSSEHMSVHKIYASNQKLTKKLKKLQKKKCNCSYDSNSLDSDSDLECILVSHGVTQ
eukprot:1747904-Ditylum_brightwellii.AAC.1